MVTLQFWRGLDKECLISIAEQKTYKVVDLGYPLLSFVSDLEISNDAIGKYASFEHIYSGLEELKNCSNLASVKTIQSFFKQIFDERIRNGNVLDLKMFEDIVISYGFEIPFHGIAKQNNNGQEIICDTYRCFYVKGLTREIIEQLCIAELHYLATNGYTIKRCENCGKLFIPKKADEKYCSRRSNEYPRMNCKEAAKYKKQLEREKASETAKMYHSINTMLARRAKVAPLSTQKQELDILYRFRDEAVSWKKRLKSNPDIEPEYINWLQSFKKRN